MISEVEVARMQAGKFNVLVVSANERFTRVLPLMFRRIETLALRVSVETPLEALHHPEIAEMDVVVADTTPSRLDEVLTWRAIRELGPKLLILTRYLERGIEMSSVLAGAAGLLLVPELHLADAVARIAAGDVMRSPELTRHLNALISGEAPTALEPIERRVLELVVSGEPDSRIASALGLQLIEVQEQIQGLALSLA
jgi:DNA-binding NarL/FixJ family response regulator